MPSDEEQPLIDNSHEKRTCCKDEPLILPIIFRAFSTIISLILIIAVFAQGSAKGNVSHWLVFEFLIGAFAFDVVGLCGTFIPGNCFDYKKKLKIALLFSSLAVICSFVIDLVFFKFVLYSIEMSIDCFCFFIQVAFCFAAVYGELVYLIMSGFSLYFNACFLIAVIFHLKQNPQVTTKSETDI